MRQRLGTSAVLAALVLVALGLASPWPIAALGIGTLIVAMQELHKLLPLSVAGAVFLTLLTFAFLIGRALLPEPDLAAIAYGVLLLGALGATAVALRVTGTRLGRRSSASALWIAAPIAACLALHLLSTPSDTLWHPSLVLLILAPVHLADTAAFFVGRWIGRTPLAPNWSPNKTWEGAAASLLVGVASFVGLAMLWNIPLGAAIGTALVVNLGAQLGDLLESGLKRVADVKDSGTLLPGHGGVLDRIDSFLLAAPLGVAALLLLAPDAVLARAR